MPLFHNKNRDATQQNAIEPADIRASDEKQQSPKLNMPEAELAPLQRELWRIVSHAQKRGAMTLNAQAQERITETHLRAALAMWRYAQDSALYIFGDCRWRERPQCFCAAHAACRTGGNGAGSPKATALTPQRKRSVSTRS